MTSNTQIDVTTDTYDNPWKEAIEVYFSDCLALLFPKVSKAIDWEQGYDFLDKDIKIY